MFQDQIISLAHIRPSQTIKSKSSIKQSANMKIRRRGTRVRQNEYGSAGMG